MDQRLPEVLTRFGKDMHDISWVELVLFGLFLFSWVSKCNVISEKNIYGR